MNIRGEIAKLRGLIARGPQAEPAVVVIVPRGADDDRAAAEARARHPRAEAVILLPQKNPVGVPT